MSNRILTTVGEMQEWSRKIRREGKRIATVPTMGALHEGHVSLIRLARSNADAVICTVFVNPTQFGPQEDFGRYPRTFESDRVRAEAAGADVIFSPGESEMYPPGFQTYVLNEFLSSVLEGAVRPGHFRGVATIVTKLLTATLPDVAVFGQKDAQQVAVIKALVRDLHLGVEILVGPIVREPDGLAMSSRNAYLSSEERKRATMLYRSLQTGLKMARGGESRLSVIEAAMRNELTKAEPAGVDYVSFVHPDTFAPLTQLRPEGTLAVLAARFGETRLLDNILITGTEN